MKSKVFRPFGCCFRSKQKFRHVNVTMCLYREVVSNIVTRHTFTCRIRSCELYGRQTMLIFILSVSISIDDTWDEYKSTTNETARRPKRNAQVDSIARALQ